MDIVNLAALNSTSFVFSRSLTPWASLYSLASGKFRAMMRTTATDPVVQYEWSTDAGTIAFAQSAANGQITFTINPANNDTITLGSSQVSFSNTGNAVTLAPFAVVTITNASPAVITWTGHGLAAGTPIVFSTTGALNTGLAILTTYYVSITGLATNSFSVSDTFNDALAGINNKNTSSAGSGVQTATAPTTVVYTANGLAAGANISFSSAATLPAQLTSGQVYFVIPTLLETNTFQIATTINGTALVFGGPHSGATFAYVGNTVPIGITIGNTLANLVAFLNASLDPQISLCTYGVTGSQVSITYDTTSLTGNLFALAASSSGATVSAPTLYGAGGVVTLTAPIGDIEVFNGAFVYDCRWEFPAIAPTLFVQLFGGAITFSEGVTR